MSFPLVRLDDLSQLLPALDRCHGWFPNFVLDVPGTLTELVAVFAAATDLVDRAHDDGLGRFVLHLRPADGSLASRRITGTSSVASSPTLSDIWRDPDRGWVVLHPPGEPSSASPRDEPLDLGTAVPLDDALAAASDLVGTHARTGGADEVRDDGHTLAERLGFSATDIVVLVNADDLGLCHAANQGVLDTMVDGVSTSASLMVPCPWARAAAAASSNLDVGVHLTLNCEWSDYLWQPLTAGASLRDRWGAMRRSVEDVWRHVDPTEAATEMEAQLVRALGWGVDVTHLDAHMYTVQLTNPLLDAYLDLAARYRLPVRLRGSGPDGGSGGVELRRRARAAGVLSTDHMVLSLDTTDPSHIDQLLDGLRPGVTELYLHPAIATPELSGFAGDWRRRAADRAALLHGGSVASQLSGADVHLVGWRELRELQRRDL